MRFLFVVFALIACADKPSAKDKVPEITTETGSGVTEDTSGYTQQDPLRAWSLELTLPSEPTDMAVAQEYPIPRREVAGTYLSPGVSSNDLNGDGHHDVVGPNGNEVLLWIGDGMGALLDPITIYTSGPEDFAIGVWTYDFDRDGDFDLLFGGWDGLTILDNDGGGTFTVSTSMYGFVPRTEMLTTVNFTDLNGDGLADVFIGYARRDFVDDVFVGGTSTHSESLEDEIYLQGTNGNFAKATMPRIPHLNTGYGWHTLHSMPFEGGIVALTDASLRSGPQSTLYDYDHSSGSFVGTWMESVLNTFIEAPMGGFCDYVTSPTTPSCWISDTRPPSVLVKHDWSWVSSGQAWGIMDRYFSWSVVMSDFDLDGRHDVAFTLGYPFINRGPISDLRNLARNAGLSVYRGQAQGNAFKQQRLLSGKHLVGTTLTDLDGDGAPELIAREVNGYQVEPTTPTDGSLKVVSQHVTVDRVELLLDVSCLDAVVSYGGNKRTFAPYTNTGSFGNGSYTLSFAYRDSEEMLIEHPVYPPQALTPQANMRQRITCAPNP